MSVLVNCFSGKPSENLFLKAADIDSIKLRHNMEWTLRNSKSMGLGFVLESALLVGGSRQEKGGKFWERLVEWESRDSLKESAFGVEAGQ